MKSLLRRRQVLRAHPCTQIISSCIPNRNGVSSSTFKKITSDPSILYIRASRAQDTTTNVDIMVVMYMIHRNEKMVTSDKQHGNNLNGNKQEKKPLAVRCVHKRDAERVWRSRVEHTCRAQSARVWSIRAERVCSQSTQTVVTLKHSLAEPSIPTWFLSFSDYRSSLSRWNTLTHFGTAHKSGDYNAEAKAELVRYCAAHSLHISHLPESESHSPEGSFLCPLLRACQELKESIHEYQWHWDLKIGANGSIGDVTETRPYLC